MANGYVSNPGAGQALTERVNAGVYGTVLGVSEDFGVKAEAIYFYNVAPSAQSHPRPPNHPHMYFAPCPKGEPWALVGQISHPFTETRKDQNDTPISVYTDGYREAARMLNPLNPGLDQDWDGGQDLQQGGNLNYFGVFWSKSNPPTAKELKAARARLEKTYRKEIERMNACKTADEARLAANDISHAAADFFGRSYSWHESNLNAQDPADHVECAACGESIRKKAMICRFCQAPQDPALQIKWLEAKIG